MQSIPTKLKFCQNGWTSELAGALAMHRQALHSSSFGMTDGTSSFNAPMAADMEMFCLEEMGFSLEQLKAVQEPFLEN